MHSEIYGKKFLAKTVLEATRGPAGSEDQLNHLYKSSLEEEKLGWLRKLSDEEAEKVHWCVPRFCVEQGVTKDGCPKLRNIDDARECNAHG